MKYPNNEVKKKTQQQNMTRPQLVLVMLKSSLLVNSGSDEQKMAN